MVSKILNINIQIISAPEYKMVGNYRVCDFYNDEDFRQDAHRLFWALKKHNVFSQEINPDDRIKKKKNTIDHLEQHFSLSLLLKK